MQLILLTFSLDRKRQDRHEEFLAFPDGFLIIYNNPRLEEMRGRMGAANCSKNK
jgi:hypothetical protein